MRSEGKGHFSGVLEDGTGLRPASLKRQRAEISSNEPAEYLECRSYHQGLPDHGWSVVIQRRMYLVVGKIY